MCGKVFPVLICEHSSLGQVLQHVQHTICGQKHICIAKQVLWRRWLSIQLILDAGNQ